MRKILPITALLMLLTFVNFSMLPSGTLLRETKAQTGPLITTITSAIDGNGATVQNGGTTTSNSIKFTFTTAGGVPPYTYVCTLEGAPIVCRQGVAFIVFLPLGTHQFTVRTTDAVGTKQTTPVFSW